jgi:hypothetical protein
MFHECDAHGVDNAVEIVGSLVTRVVVLNITFTAYFTDLPDTQCERPRYFRRHS